MIARHDVVVVGAGQAGLAASWFLTARGIEHVVLERGAVAEAWRSQRWDSFCLVTPNWTITLPGATYEGPDPGGFLDRDVFVAHLERWARSFAAPIRNGVDVRRIGGEPGDFRLETSAGPLRARAVVVATATFQGPRRPAQAHGLSPRLHQLDAAGYRNPRALPPGGVLVVGSGQSGCQIAEELCEAGRPVVLAVGKAGRLPRRYRGRDCIEWQRSMGWLDRTPDMLEDPAHRFRGDPHLSGRGGGRTLSLHRLRESGITLAGSLATAEGEALRFRDDLLANLERADAYAASFYRQVDEHIAAAGIEAPAPTAAELAGGPSAAPMPGPAGLDLATSGIGTVIWATGFAYDFGWIDFPVRDAAGYPATRRGETEVPGLCFLGLNWLYKRKSGIIYGVGEDAAHVAGRIAAHLGARGAG
ncbi:MAG: NAD(P)-binding domain-containing protein [Dongiaceae bacterium]